MTKETLLKAIERFGKEAQSIVAMEELAELQKEISKSLRGQKNQEQMAEEIADVTIMIMQLQLMYGITDEKVCEYINHKVKRLEGRLEGGTE